MKCEFDFSSYYDGEADNAEEIAAHLADCSACAKEYDDFCKLMSEVRELPEPQLPSGFSDTLIRAVRRDSFARRRRNRRLTFGQFALAAAASVLFVVVVGIMDFAVVDEMAGGAAVSDWGGVAVRTETIDMPVVAGGGDRLERNVSEWFTIADELDDSFDGDLMLGGGIIAFDEEMEMWVDVVPQAAPVAPGAPVFGVPVAPVPAPAAPSVPMEAVVAEAEPEAAVEEAEEEEAESEFFFAVGEIIVDEEWYVLRRYYVAEDTWREAESHEFIPYGQLFQQRRLYQDRLRGLGEDEIWDTRVLSRQVMVDGGYDAPEVLSERFYVSYVPSRPPLRNVVGYAVLVVIVFSAVGGVILIQKRKSE
ncbi:MAG: hypothetical protein FWB80_09140 [Defluviitaleaceae bacterium]|nr:hypothetical protein [Defluviitaleaceae bacterium]